MKEFYKMSVDVSVSGKGKYPGARSVEELVENGVIILDKWQDITSQKAVETLKKILGIKKAGHSGTLDPMVSGVLPVAMENACKIMPVLQGLDKEYVGIMKIHKDVEEERVVKAMKSFIGKIKQVPPVKSAVARLERERSIYSFDMIEKNGRDVLFKVRCQAGTYVRVLCHDVGRKLRTGAHMAELRRTKVGNFNERSCFKIQDIEHAWTNWKENKNEEIRDYIMPMEAAIEHAGTIILKDSAIQSIANGSPLYSAGAAMVEKRIRRNDTIVLMSHKGELIALAKANMDANEARRRRGVVAKTLRVVIEKGVY